MSTQARNRGVERTLLYLGGNPLYQAASALTRSEPMVPWHARDWHPTRNTLRPRPGRPALGRDVAWRPELGHVWSAVVYQRTLSGSGCPDCYRLEAAERSKAGKQRAPEARERAA